MIFNCMFKLIDNFANLPDPVFHLNGNCCFTGGQME